MNKLALFALAALFAAGIAPAHAQSTSSAAMPTCASGDPVVWENTKSKKHVYHMSGDKYYGKSKAGKYVCESQAKSDGYHAAGTKGGAMSGGTPNADAPSAAPSPAASGSMSMGKHHKHHHGMGMASPAPSPTAS
jgi:hypothetical protein